VLPLKLASLSEFSRYRLCLRSSHLCLLVAVNGTLLSLETNVGEESLASTRPDVRELFGSPYRSAIEQNDLMQFFFAHPLARHKRLGAIGLLTRGGQCVRDVTLENSSSRLYAIPAVLFAVALAAGAIIFGLYAGSDKGNGPQANVSPQEFPIPQAKPRREGTSEPSGPASSETGYASWYEMQSRAAGGEQMDANAMTAAHPSLPMGTKVLVENLSNGRSVVVRINDRGPFTGGRIIDVSKAAAVNLGMIDTGVATVRVSSLQGVSDAQTVPEENDSGRNPEMPAR
jgi:rare lipoprotein A